MGKMITGLDANNMAQRQVFNNTKKCLTCGELTANGFTVSVSRAANRLVDVSYVSSASQTKEYTVNYDITLQASNSDVQTLTYFEYILSIKPDNIEDFTNYNQMRCIASLLGNNFSGALNSRNSGVLHFPVNDNTHNIILLIYKVTPGGNEYRCSYTLGFDLVSHAFGGQFTNQVSQECSTNRLPTETSVELSLGGDLHIYSSYQSEVLTMKNLKKEIKDILNDEQ